MQISRRLIAGVLLLVFFLLAWLQLGAAGNNAEANTPQLDPTGICEAVGWSNTVNVTVSGNSIQKTGGAGSTWDAGAVSSRAIQSGDGYVQATVDALNTYRMFGLSNGDTNQTHTDIDFAVYLAGPNLMVYERGLSKGTFGSLAVGDVIKVSIEGGVVKYYKNGALFYTSSAPATYPMLLDTAINSTGGQVSNAFICGSNLGPNPTFTPTPAATLVPNCEIVGWSNTVNVTVSGNSIQKTGGAGSTWDAGAASTRAIQSGDGYVQATVDALDTYRMFGLSNGDTNQTHTDIDFAAYLAGPNLMVYERGLSKGTFGSLAVGDLVKVAVESNQVKYYRNGALLYTSALTPTYPLLLDTAINSSLGRISNAFICGANLGSIGFATATRTRTPANTPTPNPPTSTNTRTATRTGTRSPTPSSSSPTPTWTVMPGGSGVTANDVIPCPLLPADNIWNRRVDNLPVHPQSAAFVAALGSTLPLHSGFASRTWQGQSIGNPYNVVPTQQPMVNMNFTDYPDMSDPGPYPYPTYAIIGESTYLTPVPSSGDRHVSILRAGDCKLYETWHSHPNSNGSWTAANGAVFDMRSNALRPAGWTSAEAGGMAILPGLIRYDDVIAGAINHAIRFTGDPGGVRNTYTWPARHTDGNCSSSGCPPMGTRFRLKASVDISGYPQRLRVMLQTLKTYGIILADSGDSWQIDGAPDQRWDDNELQLLHGVTGADFEAVDVSGLMIDPNSGASR